MKFSIPFIKTSLAILLITSFCSAQTKKLDSLKILMETANDTTMVNLLRWQGNHTRPQNTQKALELYQQSIEKSKEIGFVQGEIKALYATGITYGMAGNYPEAFSYFRQCLEVATENNDFEHVVQSNGSLGMVYKRIGDYKTSQDYYLKNLKLADSLQLDTDMSSTYINLGILYDLMGQQEKAVVSFEKALGITPPAKRPEQEQLVLVNLATIDFENGDYEAALDKLLSSVAYDKARNDEINLSHHYGKIGMCYLNLNQLKRAEAYLKNSLQLAEKLSLPREEAIAWQYLAELRLRQKRYKEAIDYSNKNLKSLDAMASSFEEKKDGHEIAFQIYEESGQQRAAIYHLNQVMAYKDSLLNKTKVREIQNLQVQHDVYLKDREIKEDKLQQALLNTEVALNNKRLIYLAVIEILLLFSAALLYFRFTAKKKANTLLQNKNQLILEQKNVIQKMNLELEKRMLRAQMNPHFIFNSLSSIHHLISSNDRKNALNYLTKFSKLLRNVLESSINVSLSLKDEIELLKIYLELESLRFDNSFSYSISIDKKLDIHEHEVPMLLVQPYLENAIMHGLMPKNGKKELFIAFNDKKEYVECIIEDNGVGIDAEPAKKFSKRPSRGMSITANRINALKKFSDKELINVESINRGDHTGTKVTILIPKRDLAESTQETTGILTG